MVLEQGALSGKYNTKHPLPEGTEKIVVHDAFDPESNVQIGVLPSGAPLVIDRTAVDTDLLIAEGFIEPHFFAGFSGGRKSILPGVCDKTTVLGNHCGAFIASPYARTGILEGIALLNDAVKKGGVMASNHVGGLSGAFIPVSEDAGMIHAAETGCLTIEKLEAMTAVCSVGIDMVIIPGDTTPAVISALIADEAAIGMVNSKTTAVRVIPAIGRKAGEVLDFGGLLGYGPIMAVNQHDPSVFINRGGRLPAPMQSLKN